MATNSSFVPETFDPRYTQYYQLLSQCSLTDCPDAYWDYTDNCNVNICPLESSNWDYLPSLAANGTFIALFSISLACYLAQGVLSRKFWGFTIAMVCGCILEVLGYAGRIMSYYSPWGMNGFLMQIVCLTIAPAFLAAGIYLTLSRIVITVGESNSRIKARSYPRIFIPCDFISLLLQAIGGGMASTASNNHESPDTGDHIMVAGLAFQVFTLALFILICTDFAIRAARNPAPKPVVGDDSNHARLRSSPQFKGFLVALSLATVCIFIRSIYRVIELAQGWEGELIKNQRYFIVLEGVMVIVAVLALNAFHPAWCFREGYHGDVTHALKGKKGQTQSSSEEESGQSEKQGRKGKWWTIRGRG